MARPELKVVNGTLHQRVFRSYFRQANPFLTPVSSRVRFWQGVFVGWVACGLVCWGIAMAVTHALRP
jgi:hypothetical protein